MKRLYNFGFATAQNLPQLNEETTTKIPFEIRISGNGLNKSFSARIVGFSDRLNTILVPDNFIKHTNMKYGSGETLVSRLIITTPDPSSVELLNYLDSKDYDFNQDKLSNSKAKQLLTATISIVISIGIIFSILSTWVYILSHRLLIQKNNSKIKNLKLIGYSSNQIMRNFNILSIIGATLSYILSVGIFFAVSKIIILRIRFISDQQQMHIPILFGLIFIIFLTIFDLYQIRKSIKKI